MLYFSKLKVIFIYSLIIFLSYFSFSNFLSQNYKLFDNKINLGLDLQGGSYLLLEIDSNPIVLQKLQNKFSDLIIEEFVFSLFRFRFAFLINK